MKKIAVLGSTGSIGRQTLEVVEANPSLFSIEILSAFGNTPLLLEQIEKFKPHSVFILNPSTYDKVSKVLSHEEVLLFNSWELFPEQLENVDFVLGAISGAAGIEPTLMALELGITVGIANKETLVAAGDLVEEIVQRTGAILLPVDSEHSAIFQSLQGSQQIEKLIITASGGPFRQLPIEQFIDIKPSDALSHPNWVMGSKITVDSATLMNKGLEVIEAHRLFNVDYDDIEVIVHPESIVHSMVQFIDGSVIAQMGCPDMRGPIQYALTWPTRQESHFPRMDLLKIGTLHFEIPRYNDFPALNLAYEAGKLGGSATVVLNAANEEAVRMFLEDKIRFVDIVPLIQGVMDRIPHEKIKELSQLKEIDYLSRCYLAEYIGRVKR